MEHLQWFFINSKAYSRNWLDANPNAAQMILKQAKENSGRAVCLCNEPGIPMYVAKHKSYYLARMPGTGSQHRLTCPSYAPEAPDGLDPVKTGAISELGNNLLAVHLASSLFRYTESQPDAREIASPNTDPNSPQEMTRLTLSGLLQLLFDRAGFNRWPPNMEGKRDWYVIRKFLLQEAAHIFVKGEALSERLFIPRTFNKLHAESLANKRDEWLNRVCRQEDGKRQMGIIVGQIRALQDTKYGGRLIIRHLPNFPFWIPEELYKVITNRCFRELSELEPTDQPSRNRLVAIMTVERRPSGSYAVNEMAIVRTNQHWLPIWSRFGGQLADKLVKEQRHFLVPMRYDAVPAAVTPACLLLDSGNHTISMYVPQTDDKITRKHIESIQDTEQNMWIWDIGKTGISEAFIPEFPPRAT